MDLQNFVANIFADR